MAICSGWKTFLQQFWQVWTLCDCAPVTQENLYSLVIHNSQLNVHEQSPCPIHVGWISRAKTSGLSRLSDLPDILRDRLLFPAWEGGGARGFFFMSRYNFPYPRLCNIPIPHHHPQPSHWKLIASQSLLHTALAMTNLPSVPLKTMWFPKILPPRSGDI